MNNTITFPKPTLFGTLELIKSVYRSLRARVKGSALEAEYTQPVYFLTDLGCVPIAALGGAKPRIILFASMAESHSVGKRMGGILVCMVAERSSLITQAKALGMGTIQYTDIQDLF